MIDIVTLLGLWLGALGVWTLGYFVYRCFYHTKRALWIARALTR